MDKVKITREQADVIEHLKSKIFEKDIVRDHVLVRGGWLNESQPLNELGLDTLIRALYIGYEVEETPEDKVIRYYNEISQSGFVYTSEDVTGIIKNILIDLNIKIEGVNA